MILALEVRSVLNVGKSHLYPISRSSVKNDTYDNKLPRQMLKMLHNVGLSSSSEFFCRFRKGNTYIYIYIYRNICQICGFHSFCRLGIERVSLKGAYIIYIDNMLFHPP